MFILGFKKGSLCLYRRRSFERTKRVIGQKCVKVFDENCGRRVPNVGHHLEWEYKNAHLRMLFNVCVDLFFSLGCGLDKTQTTAVRH